MDQTDFLPEPSGVFTGPLTGLDTNELTVSVSHVTYRVTHRVAAKAVTHFMPGQRVTITVEDGCVTAMDEPAPAVAKE